MKKLTLAVLCTFLGFVPLTGQAKDAEPDKPQKNEIVAAAEEFTADFNEADTRHFNVLYGNYNLIKVVESVRESVDLGVEACQDANAEMKEPLEQRFDEWKATIKPIMEEADGNVSNMILAQSYAKPRAIRKFLKKIDKARKDKSKGVEKRPVTSLEDCKNLLKDMDKTQPTMVRLLEATLVSLPQVMQAEDEKAKADAKAKEEAAAAKAAEKEAKKKAKEAEKAAAEKAKEDAEKADEEE